MTPEASKVHGNVDPSFRCRFATVGFARARSTSRGRGTSDRSRNGGGGRRERDSGRAPTGRVFRPLETSVDLRYEWASEAGEAEDKACRESASGDVPWRIARLRLTLRGPAWTPRWPIDPEQEKMTRCSSTEVSRELHDQFTGRGRSRGSFWPMA